MSKRRGGEAGDRALDSTVLLTTLASVKRGDFRVRLPMDAEGVAGKVYDTLNEIIERNQQLTEELERLGRSVGRDGRISDRASLPTAAGSWKSCVEAVNDLVTHLVRPTAEVSRVIGAVAKGDLSQSMPVELEGKPLRGEFVRTAKLVNRMVHQLSSFASEVTRVAREVGTEGKLGGQAVVKGVSGTWKDLTDNVNSMASNLTAQVRNIADVTTAVARGDLSKKITVDVKGEILELKDTINTMVDQLGSFASEVTRVAREVGTEGKLGGQAVVGGVSGTWKDLTDNVNSMASNLTAQVRNIADVTTAVARGDLSKKIAVDVKGEILELKNTINTMVDQLGSFASEVTRVAREVGTEGKLGGQAVVKGVAGTWKDLTDNVNSMASGITAQVRDIANVATAVAHGDLGRKVTADVKGEILELKQTINKMVDNLNIFSMEVTRVAREVGTEGKLGGQAVVKGVAGTWKDLTDNVNSMASNLTAQVRNIADVTTAVARGDLSKKITVDVKGEILELKNTINTMVDQLGSFASEVTRVAREVGTEGKLGGQAVVGGVSGTWKDLTDHVNFMASNLTAQVRGIAMVVTAVASGDLKRKLDLEAKGEIASLAKTINEMTETLAIFADQVTDVARKVGTEGKLGGQARVPGASGTWRDLTDNVNQLAANLTTQVRAIAEVATAVTKGDLTRSIAVKARGEVAALKDNINQMIGNLRETTQKNKEQDWLKTNLARFTAMLQGQRDLETVSQLILSELAPLVSTQYGAFYIRGEESAGDTASLKLLSSYGRARRRTRLEPGEGLVGQCGVEKRRFVVSDVPDDYVKISSGLGEAKPRNIVILPVLFEGEVRAVIELASFDSFKSVYLTFLDQLTENIGIVLNTIAAGMQTEGLLAQSQSLTEELRHQKQELTETNQRLEQQAQSLRASEELLKQQQEKLQQTNEELEKRSELLQQQKAEVELKNHEIEQAKMALEERAQQLALSSKYKSEFLANMSHELRTPLNSLLILAELLATNAEGNLTSNQVEFARTIHDGGSDLQLLINDILDLSKIESGTMAIAIDEVAMDSICEFVERTFRPVAQSKGLDFEVERAPDLWPTMHTDSRRAQQVLKNLLANAFKFTDAGRVVLRVEHATGGWSYANETLSEADDVIAFSVLDTGIGIPLEKQKVIFEAFQQADGSTSRKHGGTGLGLSISREIALFLGGEVTVSSEPGKGSTFTFFLPRVCIPPARAGGDGSGRNGASAHGHTRAEPAGPAAQSAREAAGVLTLKEPPDSPCSIERGDRVLLVVEDAQDIAAGLVEAGRASGFRVLVASRGDVGLVMAREFRPDAIVVSLNIPVVDGWTVLGRLKSDARTRHIPVHMIASSDESRALCLRSGASGLSLRPANEAARRAIVADLEAFAERSLRELLVLESDEERRGTLNELLEGPDVRVATASSLAEMKEAVARVKFDCALCNMDIGDVDRRAEILRGICEISAERALPAVIYAADDFDAEQLDALLQEEAEHAIVRIAGTLEELVDQTALFLHRVERSVSGDLDAHASRAPQPERPLAGKKILVVDDDIRNIFAVTSLLERHDAEVFYAEDGRKGIEILEGHPDIDVVLMDLMMPEMDGYQTVREIRKNPRFESLPIIALTAKAMKGDREKCIEAGASDYITKPVEAAHLLSRLRLWIQSGATAGAPAGGES